MTLKAYQGKEPRLGADVFVAENALVIGDAVLGDGASVWYGCVLRADVGKIRIGPRSNVQDLSVLHVDSKGFDCTVGGRVTIGHRVVLHGCSVGNLALVGIGAIVLNGAEVGEQSIIAAGSVVTPGTRIPPGVLALGSPCRVKRSLTDAERAMLRDSAERYVGYAREHR